MPQKPTFDPSKSFELFDPSKGFEIVPTDDQPPATLPDAKKPSWADAVLNFGKNYLSGTVGGLIDSVMAGYNPNLMALQAANMGYAHLDQLNKSKAAYYKGNNVEATAHLVAGLWPAIGPAAAQAGEQIASGDISGGLGSAAALLTPFGIGDAFAGANRVLSNRKLLGGLEDYATRTGADAMVPKAGPNRVKFAGMAKDSAPTVLRGEGMGAWSPETLLKKVDEQTDRLSDGLDDLYASLPRNPLDLTKIKEGLASKLDELSVKGNVKGSTVNETAGSRDTGIIDPSTGNTVKVAASTLPDNITLPTRMEPSANADQAGAIRKALDEIDALGDNASITDLRQLAKAWGKGAKNQYIRDATADAFKLRGEGSGWADSERVLRDYIADQDPRIAKQNEIYHAYRSARDVLEAADAVARTRPPGRSLAGAVAGAAGGAALGGVEGATLGTVLVPVLDAMVSGKATTRINTARTILKFTDAMRAGKAAQAQASLADLARRANIDSVLLKPAMEAIPELIRRGKAVLGKAMKSDETGAIDWGKGGLTPKRQEAINDLKSHVDSFKGNNNTDILPEDVHLYIEDKVDKTDNPQYTAELNKIDREFHKFNVANGGKSTPAQIKSFIDSLGKPNKITPDEVGNIDGRYTDTGVLSSKDAANLDSYVKDLESTIDDQLRKSPEAKKLYKKYKLGGAETDNADPALLSAVNILEAEGKSQEWMHDTILKSQALADYSKSSGGSDINKMVSDLGVGDSSMQLRGDEPTTFNASGESAASVEAMNRDASMKKAGRQFVVYDAAGNEKPLIGPDAVDYKAGKGETYGIKHADGTFTKLDDNGGKIPKPVPEEQPVSSVTLGRLIGQATTKDQLIQALSAATGGKDTGTGKTIPQLRELLHKAVEDVYDPEILVPVQKALGYKYVKVIK